METTNKKPMSLQQKAYLYSLINDLGYQFEVPSLALEASDGRTASIEELYSHEASRLISSLQRVSQRNRFRY